MPPEAPSPPPDVVGPGGVGPGGVGPGGVDPGGGSALPRGGAGRAGGCVGNCSLTLRRWRDMDRNRKKHTTTSSKMIVRPHG
ncbi:MAG: hypothetical protein EPN43_11860, partial [Jatrophihabitans sp.]